MTADPRPPTPETWRLFVAVELPEPWKDALSGLQDEMRSVIAREPELSRMRVRWSRPDGIHLTLKFLGPVPVSEVPRVTVALESAIPATPGIELRLDRAGSFADRRAPRVIIATISIAGNSMRLTQLATRIEDWLASAGFPRERRAFAPHLTLGRLPEDATPEARRRVAELTTSLTVPKPPPFTISAVSLMRSQIMAGGARYERIASFPT
jgi:2'-5' RNA ligase